MNGEEMDRAVSDHAAGSDVAPMLDEAAFIRIAERRSVRRTLTVSLVVVVGAVVLIAMAWAGWRVSIDRQAERIRNYLPALVRITMPNNEVSEGRLELDFPRASVEYGAYRRVGGSIVPAGTLTVTFYPWGGESVDEPRHLSDVSDGRLILEPGTTTDLLFLEPPVGGGDARDVWSAGAMHDPFLSTFANARETSLAGLEAAPTSSTVELAVSFDDVMTLEQLQQRLGSDLRLVWGALRVGSAGELVDSEGVVREAGTSWWPHFPGLSGFTVGIPFAGLDGTGETPAETEIFQLSEFAGLARLEPGRRGKVRQERSDYLTKNGAQYFGAVVIGSPAAALELAKSPDVSTVTLGAVAMPW